MQDYKLLYAWEAHQGDVIHKIWHCGFSPVSFLEVSVCHHQTWRWDVELWSSTPGCAGHIETYPQKGELDDALAQAQCHWDVKVCECSSTCSDCQTSTLQWTLDYRNLPNHSDGWKHMNSCNIFSHQLYLQCFCGQPIYPILHVWRLRPLHELIRTVGKVSRPVMHEHFQLHVHFGHLMCW